MTIAPTNSVYYDAILADLEAKRAEIDAAIETLKRVRAMGVGAPVAVETSAPEPAIVSTSIKEKPVPVRLSAPGIFFGMTLPEAATKVLEVAEKPMLAREIWVVLEAAKFPTTSKNPVHQVHWALRRRAEKIHDVLLVGVGKWGIMKWYTEEQLMQIATTLGGMAGRDRETHIAKTKQGIANLRANGVRWGPPIVVTAEKIEHFYKLSDSGMRKADAAKIAGFAISAYYWYYRRYKVKNWRPGDPWPPPPREDAPEPEEKNAVEPTQLRLVK